MRKILLSCCLLCFLLLFLSLKKGARTKNLPANTRREALIGCSPSADAAAILPNADGRYAPVFPGWGHYHYPISTSSDSAQYYFDQGLSLYYGYHLTEAVASFKEAAVKDSNCVMAYWGQALAMGPYYNNTYYYKMPPAVLPVLGQMNRLANSATAKEKALISALDLRYSADTADSHRSDLNRAYSERMKELIATFPDDVDVKALFIDGVMIEHAWDLWDNKGVAKTWTPELVKYCEDILARNPYHPAALHYHIHLLEASRHPEITLPSADKLKDVAPGVAHLVHMASHSYQRTGLYAKGIAVNDSANAAHKYYDSIAGQLHLGAVVVHYYAVEAYCALNAATYQKAKMAAAQCQKTLAANRLISQRNYLQYLYMVPLFVQVKLGKWAEILDQPLPDRSWVYASLLDDFGRGMAYVRTGNITAAQRCLDSLTVKMKNPALLIRQLPYNAAIAGAGVAEGILEGELLFAQGKPREGMAAFRRAIEREDGMFYLEPKDWLLPARLFAGVYLLKLKRPAEAERLYREDLIENPGNGWALLGLAQSLEAQHKKGAAKMRARVKEAAALRAQAREAFKGAEEEPKGSAY